jgi:hypothetical protein
VLEDFLRSVQDDSGGQRQPRLTVWVLQSCIGRVRQV